MNKQIDIKEWYISLFSTFEKALKGDSELPVHQLRKAALEKLGLLTFPTTKDEEWRYTNIEPIVQFPFQFDTSKKSKLTKKKIAQYMFHKADFDTLVFVNGMYQGHLSKVEPNDNVVISSLEKASIEYKSYVEKYLGNYVDFKEDIFPALNTAFVRQGTFLLFKKHTETKKPIHILYLNDSKERIIAQPRNLIIAEEFSKAQIFVQYESLSDVSNFTNAVTEIVLHENANVNHVTIQNEDTNSFHISNTAIRIDKHANFTSYNMNFGGKIARNNITATFKQSDAECHLFGLYMGGKDQLIDNHTLIDHAQPNCNSNELYKGVLTGNARAVFNGKVMVRKDAQKTNAFQQNKNILLSKEALIDTKPQLEIFADDVKCSHGATVGQLDTEALFYLRARGLDKEAARTLLISAFAEDVVKKIGEKHVIEYLEEKISQKLNS